MARDDSQMKLRLPDHMRDLISDAAKAAGRSMNAEILARLEKTFQWDAGAYPADFESQVRQIAREEYAKTFGEMRASLLASGWTPIEGD